MHILEITISASLRSLILLLMSAIPSGMLYYFDYDFDHKEKKLKEVGWFYQNNLVSWCSGIFFLRIISNSAIENCRNNYSMGFRCHWD